jgi:hypothetical protein
MTEPRLEWSEEERQALGAYRKALSPTGAQVKAALGGVSATLGISLADGAAAQTVTSQAPAALAPSAGAVKGTVAAFDLASRAAVIKATLGAIALGGAVTAYGVLEPLAPKPDLPGRPTPTLTDPAAVRSRDSSRALADEPPVEPAERAEPAEPVALEELPEATGQGEVLASPRGVSQTGPAESAASPVSPASPPVHEELGALRQAQSALGAGRPGQALELMEKLGDANPGGRLLVERELTRVLALCALGRETEAWIAAARVQQLPGGDAYRTRLADSCVGQSIPTDEPIEGAH